jgi:hypothetical protein
VTESEDPSPLLNKPGCWGSEKSPDSNFGTGWVGT